MSLASMISSKDVAVYLGVATKTVWKMCRDGTIPFHDLPCGIRFKESEISAWVESKKKTPRGRKSA